MMIRFVASSVQLGNGSGAATVRGRCPAAPNASPNAAAARAIRLVRQSLASAPTASRSRSRYTSSPTST
ncbi:MAG TPA: hypothetical protein VH539_01245, partial [Gemmatimonadaceae bacterium]